MLIVAQILIMIGIMWASYTIGYCRGYDDAKRED